MEITMGIVSVVLYIALSIKDKAQPCSFVFSANFTSPIMRKLKEVYTMKKRGFLGLLLDLILTLVTGGLWLIWLLIKYLRNGNL